MTKAVAAAVARGAVASLDGTSARDGRDGGRRGDAGDDDGFEERGDDDRSRPHHRHRREGDAAGRGRRGGGGSDDDESDGTESDQEDEEDEDDEDDEDDSSEEVDGGGGAGARRWGRRSGDGSEYARLAAIPVLLLSCESDVTHPKETAEALHALLPRSQLHVAPDFEVSDDTPHEDGAHSQPAE